MIEELLTAILRAPGQVAMMAVAALAFLPAPDVDLLFLRLLHHRSILTHSVLLPIFVLWGAGPLGLDSAHAVAAAAGAGLGVAVHLAADLLSPSHGYGRIWWPEPFQRSLGRWSPAWILLNAVGAAWLAFAWLPDGLRLVGFGVGGVAALGYGIRRERSLLSALVGLAVVVAGHAAERWLRGG